MYRSKGAWDGGRFGWLKFNKFSLNEFNDCSNQRAGGTAASLYLFRKKKILYAHFFNFREKIV